MSDESDDERARDFSPEANPDIFTELGFELVQITPEYIKANGTMHTTPFGGIAELVDNAVDSGAKNVQIESHKDGPGRYISVLDDGGGMDREEALKTMLMGHSMKRVDGGTIRQFGNGLKSGSIRVGNTMLLATKKNSVCTVLMLSLPFLNSLPGHKCFVPCISYIEHPGTKKLKALVNVEENKKKHAAALQVISKHSPFHSEDSLRSFLKTSFGHRSSGTCVVLHGLKRLEDSKWELKTRADDLVVLSTDDDEPYARLSEHLQQLYFNPNIVITINNRQVRMIDPLRSLAEPRWTQLSRSGMKEFAKREQDNIADALKTYEADRTEMKLKCTQAFSRVQDSSGGAMIRNKGEHQRALDELAALNAQIDAIKAHKTDKGAHIRVYFGIDPANRGQPRMVFYSNGRRICTHPIPLKGETFKHVMGVVCIVNIPSTLLPTKLSREHFETFSAFHSVVKKIVPLAKTYFAHVDKRFKTPEFWKSLGYDSDEQYEMAHTERKGVARKIFESMINRRQCSRCRTFRTVEWTNEDDNDSLEASRDSFKCEGGVCRPKTREELAGEEIRELDTKRTKPTYYGEVEAVNKTKKKEDEKKKAMDKSKKSHTRPSSRFSSPPHSASSSPDHNTRPSSRFPSLSPSRSSPPGNSSSSPITIDSDSPVRKSNFAGSSLAAPTPNKKRKSSGLRDKSPMSDDQSSVAYQLQPKRPKKADDGKKKQKKFAPRSRGGTTRQETARETDAPPIVAKKKTNKEVEVLTID